jgi:hypothetical protein
MSLKEMQSFENEVLGDTSFMIRLFGERHRIVFLPEVESLCYEINVRVEVFRALSPTIALCRQ